jgi:hypothetical protein
VEKPKELRESLLLPKRTSILVVKLLPGNTHISVYKPGVLASMSIRIVGAANVIEGIPMKTISHINSLLFMLYAPF